MVKYQSTPVCWALRCGFGVIVLEKVLPLMRPIHAGALLAHVKRPPPGQGLSEQKHVGRPDTLIFIIIALRLARLGR